MVDININVTINAPPQKVYEALTQEKHLKLWWTPDSKAEPKVGSEAKFEFKDYGDYIVFNVEKLEPNKLVEWKVTDSKMGGTPEWNGTTVSFELAENENGGTDLNFIHKDWKDETELYKKCTDGWNYFVGDSLKSYLETGKGKPFTGQ